MATNSYYRANALNDQIIKLQCEMARVTHCISLISEDIAYGTRILTGKLPDNDVYPITTLVAANEATLATLIGMSTLIDERIQSMIDEIGDFEQQLQSAGVEHTFGYLNYVKQDISALSVFQISQLNEWLRANLSMG